MREGFKVWIFVIPRTWPPFRFVRISSNRSAPFVFAFIYFSLVSVRVNVVSSAGNVFRVRHLDRVFPHPPHTVFRVSRIPCLGAPRASLRASLRLRGSLLGPPRCPVRAP